MGTKNVGFTLEETVVDKIDKEADQLGMSRSEYMRKHIDVGRRVMGGSGTLDREFLETVVEDDTDNLTNKPITSLNQIEDEVLDAVPADSRRAVSVDEITRSVFGTTEEQTEQIKNVLDILNDRGRITITADAEAYMND